MTGHIDVDPETGEVLTEGVPDANKSDLGRESPQVGTPSVSTDLAVQGPVNLLGVSDPAMYLERVKDVADQLVQIINQRKLYTVIKGKKHVEVQAWTYLGSMLGVFSSVVGEPEPIEANGSTGWKATAEARTLGGALVGRATAICTRDESSKNWLNADEHDVMAMAQTRAIRNSLRHPLGFIVHLAGFEVPDDKPRSDAQNSRFHALLAEWVHELQDENFGLSEAKEQIRSWAKARGWPDSSTKWTTDQMGEAMEEIEARIQSAKVPF